MFRHPHQGSRLRIASDGTTPYHFFQPQLAPSRLASSLTPAAIAEEWISKGAFVGQVRRWVLMSVTGEAAAGGEDEPGARPTAPDPRLAPEAVVEAQLAALRFVSLPSRYW